MATCLILHLEDIPKSLMEWRRVLKVGRSIWVYVHCEPGFLLRVAQALSTKQQFTKRGINYNLWQYSEHVTYFIRAETLMLKAFEYDKVSSKKIPTNFVSFNFALWEI
jgi:ubiquinone/menaquinone biosynthesis C-methylase UbiE